LIGFVAFTTLKLFPVYMEDFNISGALSAMEGEPDEYPGAMAVHSSVLKRFSVNNITRATRDDVSVTRDGQDYNISVEYEVIIPYMGNISLLLSFSHAATVRASGY